MNSKSLHVFPNGGKWSVRVSGAIRGRNFGSLREAVAVAETMGKNLGTRVYIHGLDGRIKRRQDYTANSASL
jgi:Uncharacterized protein conserved in bacteria (DUF2188)